MKNILVIILATLFLSFSSISMATEVVDNIKGNVIELTSLDSADEDWAWTDLMVGADDVGGIYIQLIIFNTTAASDVCVFKEGDDSGPRLWPALKTSDEYDDRLIPYCGTLLKPVLDISECTFSAGATITIILSR